MARINTSNLKVILQHKSEHEWIRVNKGFCGYCLFHIILRFNFDRKNENLLIDIIVRRADIDSVYTFMTIDCEYLNGFIAPAHHLVCGDVS